MTDELDFDELLAIAVHEPPLLIPGTKLAGGKLVISRVLGTGGMGVVYKGYDTTHRRDIAIKVLSRVEAAGIYRLKQEFRSLSCIDHPNLVTLHELFCDRNGWFFTMDLVEGQPISKTDWTASRIRDVFAQVADGIHAIHASGKLHRDVKPTNVMLTETGRVVILDFGLVSDQVPGGAGQTVVEEGIIGTPAYMAPEQSDAPASPASDWYAFGTMLYEVLYGTLPFPSGGLSVLIRKRRTPARPPPSARPVPDDLAQLCIALLQREPSRRPRYDEIAAVLRRRHLRDVVDIDVTRDVFVGREHELRAMRGALAETDKGRAVAVLISGEPGVGKTALVERFVREARGLEGAVVISGLCRRHEHVPLEACDSLVDDLSRYLRGIASEQAAHLLPRHTCSLVRVFPVLERIPVVGSVKEQRAVPQDPGEVRRQGVAALCELIGNIAAQQRLIVFVDDLHWSDVEGGRLLASLVALPRPPALMLVVCHRTGVEHADGLRAFLDRLNSGDDLRITRLALRGLSDGESEQLTELLLDQHQSRTRIASEAGGNPLLIRQMVRCAIESDPIHGRIGLEDVVRLRLERLDAQQRRALEAICLAGAPIDLPTLADVAGDADQGRIVRTLEALHLARNVPGESDVVAIFHDRVQSAIAATMTSERAREIHCRFVDVLERSAHPDLASLTVHLFGAGRPADASECARAAARQAEANLSFERAAGMYRLALRWGRWERALEVELRVHLADCLVFDQRFGEGAEVYISAAALESQAEARLSLEIRAAESFLAGGRVREGVEQLERTMAELGLDYRAIRTSNPLHLRDDLVGRISDMVAAERELDVRSSLRLRALDVAGRGLAFVKTERLQFRFALAREALDSGSALHLAAGLSAVATIDAEFLPNDDGIRRAVASICEKQPGDEADWIRASMEMSTAFVQGRPWLQLAASHRAEESLLRRSRCDVQALNQVRFHRALSLVFLGELRELLERGLLWLEEAEDRNDHFVSSWLNTMLAHGELAIGSSARARVLSERARQVCDATDDEPSLLKFGWRTARLLCEAFDGGDPWRESQRIDASAARSPLTCFRCLHHYYRAIAALCSGEEASAEESIAILLQDSRPLVLPHWRVMGTLMNAGLNARLGRIQQALASLDNALAQMSVHQGYVMYEAYARRRMGLLTANDAQVDQAEADLTRLGVKHPSRHERVMLPGFSTRITVGSGDGGQ